MELVLESPTLDELEYYNPGAEEVTKDFILEAITVDQFSRTEKRMAAVVRTFNKHLAESDIKALPPIVGKPKKSGTFAYVIVQLPFSDGQTVNVVFHSPEGDKKQIGANDTIIAFRWLLNKRDITQVVAPEEGSEVSLETIAKRITQLVVKNSAKFEKQQKAAQAERQELDKAREDVKVAEDRQRELMDSIATCAKETESVDAQLANTLALLEKQKAINAELQAKIDALRKAQSGNNNRESVNGYTYESLGGILKKSFENIEKTAWAQKYPNIVKSYKADITELAFDALEDSLTPLTPEQFMDEINSGKRQGTKLEDYKNNLIEHQNLLADIESGKVSYTMIHGRGRGGGKKGAIATVKEWLADDEDAIATNGIGTTDFMQSYKSYLENIIAAKAEEYLNNNSSDKGDKEKQDSALVDQTSNKLSQIDPSIQTGIENELEKLSDPNAKKAKKEVTRKIEKHEIDPPAPEALTVTRMAIPGRTQAEEANYEVIEADDVQASHLPEAGFQRNPKYGLENERRYHAEPDSQAKVLRNAVDLNPDFVLRDSVDANQGAPVIDQDNNVLGGNGRAMSIRKAYITGGEKANLYRKALMVRAAQLGISAAKIEAMKHPMLVRRLATAYSKEERQRLVSQLNDTFTDTKNARMSGKSRGDRFGKKTLDLLGQGMQNADTLRQFFDLPDSRAVVESLIDDGVIQQTERNAYVSPDGLLNPDGKRVVEEALRGRMARKYETLASIPGDVLAKLDAVAPSIIIAETIGGDWNLTEHIRDAVDLLAEYKNSPFCKKDDFHTFLKNVDIMKGVAPVDRYSNVSIQIFLMLLAVKKGELIKRFRKYAFDAQNISQDTGALPGVSVTAQQSALKNLNIDLGSSNTQIANQRQRTPQPDIPACVNDLNDILSGKYDADSDKVMELLESSLAELENKGLLPTYEKLLNDASDHLTELLEKEVVL